MEWDACGDVPVGLTALRALKSEMGRAAMGSPDGLPLHAYRHLGRWQLLLQLPVLVCACACVARLTVGADLQESSENRFVSQLDLPPPKPEPVPAVDRQSRRWRREGPPGSGRITDTVRTSADRSPADVGQRGTNLTEVEVGLGEVTASAPIVTEKTKKEPDAHPELLPKFHETMEKFKHGWPFHVYFFGVLFTVVAVLSGSSLALMLLAKLEATPLSLPTLLLLKLTGLCRGLQLLIDPYSSNKVFGDYVSRILLGVAMPLLTTAYALIFAAMVRASTAKSVAVLGILRDRRRLLAFLASMATFYVVTECLAQRFVATRPMVLICQGMFICWGVFLFAGFLFVGRRLSHQLSVFHSRATKPTASGRKKYSAARRAILQSTGITAMLGLFFLAFQLYTLVDTAITPAGKTNADPVPWFVSNTALRTIELLMSLSLFHIAVGSKHNTSVLLHVFCCGPKPGPIQRSALSSNRKRLAFSATIPSMERTGTATPIPIITNEDRPYSVEDTPDRRDTGVTILE